MTAISPLLLVEPPAHRAEVATFPSRHPSLVEPPRSPRLRSIEGGRSARARHQRRVYRQRRLVAVLVGVVTVLGLGRMVIVVGDVFASPVAGPSSAAATGSAADVPEPLLAGAGTYVVQPGDTLWSIAQRVRPGADPRAVVDELAARVPRGGLQPGQRIDLSDLDG